MASADADRRTTSHRFYVRARYSLFITGSPLALRSTHNAVRSQVWLCLGVAHSQQLQNTHRFLTAMRWRLLLLVYSPCIPSRARVRSLTS